MKWLRSGEEKEKINYYNDNDPFVAQWLRNLIAGGKIPKGDVDDRSITEVMKDDIKGYTQCHFFAGIAGWSLALQFSGWPEDKKVWTGSCPCQPFSVAGKGKGTEDKRHLWPEFHRLIKECKPTRILGEQVASPAGRLWLSRVYSDLEALGYARGGADLCAAGISAPHIRQRLYWVAFSDGRRHNKPKKAFTSISDSYREDNRVSVGSCSRMGKSIIKGLEGHAGDELGRDKSGREQEDEIGSITETVWSDSIRISFKDGKQRRIKPGLMPLVNGFPGRVGQIRSYGNSIVPQVAAEFISAFMELEKGGKRNA